MPIPVPKAFVPARDASSAEWIAQSVKPWGPERVRLSSFLPDVFERYARVLHPAYREGGRGGSVRWSELARRIGVRLEPDTGFRTVSGIDPNEQSAWNEAEPNEGNLERDKVAALAEFLAPFTQTPECCFIASWEGWGNWRPGSSSRLMAFTKDHTEPDVVEIASTEGSLEAIPKLEIPHRTHFLFTARLLDVPAFEIAGWHQAPNYWWPEDRAWCVMMEVDGYSTYVGGTSECIDALLASSDVEAIVVPPDVPIDTGVW